MDLDCIDEFAQFDLAGVDSFRSLDDMMGGETRRLGTRWDRR